MLMLKIRDKNREKEFKMGRKLLEWIIKVLDNFNNWYHIITIQ